MEITTDLLLTAAFIFALRVINNAVGTVRLVLLARQEKLLTSVLAFFEALVFAVTITGVVTDLRNGFNLMAYCGGFAVGSYVGLLIEARLITSFSIVNIFSQVDGHQLALALRQAGFGVTEIAGEGHSGKVTMLRSMVNQRDVPRMMTIVEETEGDAFVALEPARSVQGGYLRRPRSLTQ